MEKEEIFDILDEYYLKKKLQELHDGYWWRVIERVVFVVFIILPAGYLILHSPLAEPIDYTPKPGYVAIIDNEGEICEIPIEDYNPSPLPGEQFFEHADVVFVAIILLIPTVWFMIAVSEHTKTQAKESVGLIIGFCSLLLAALQYIQPIF